MMTLVITEDLSAITAQQYKMKVFRTAKNNQTAYVNHDANRSKGTEVKGPNPRCAALNAKQA